MRPDYRRPAETILITGASGFLGTQLARFLGTTNNELHGISRKPQTFDKGSLHWWQGDLANFDVVRSLLMEIKPDLIFHLTTHGQGAPGLEHVLPTLRNDVLATINVLTAAAELKLRRLVVTASLEEPETSDSEIIPSSPYAAAKWTSSTYARMFHRLYGTPIVLTRIFMTYGPGQSMHKLIPYVIRCLLTGQVPQLSGGQRLIDWIYIDDVISGLVAAAQVEDIEGCTVDLGSGMLVSIRDVVDQVVAITDREIQPKFGVLPPRPIEPVRAANINESYARLGWKAVTPLDEGLRLTVNWCKAQLEKEHLYN